MLHMMLLADKKNLSFIYQEEPKHSAGHHCQYLSSDYHSALTLISHNFLVSKWVVACRLCVMITLEAGREQKTIILQVMALWLFG